MQREMEALQEALQDKKCWISHILGKGAYSTVYLLHQSSSGPPVAVKQLSKKALSSQQQEWIAFRERKMLLRIQDHPFIVQLIKSVQTPSAIYFCMEYIDGCNSSLLMRKFAEGLSLCIVKIWGRYVAEALNFMHNHEVMYRDLKLENIMITTSGFPKLVDFGLANSFYKEQRDNKTYHSKERCKTRCGTYCYMAPELFSEDGQYDEMIDVWAMGVVLYEWMLGSPPFEAPNSHATVHRVLKGSLYIPTAFLKTFPDAAALLVGLLERNPATRRKYFPNGFASVLQDQFFTLSVSDTVAMKEALVEVREVVTNVVATEVKAYDEVSLSPESNSIEAVRQYPEENDDTVVWDEF